MARRHRQATISDSGPILFPHALFAQRDRPDAAIQAMCAAQKLDVGNDRGGYSSTDFLTGQLAEFLAIAIAEH
jgi:hypothetical protein